MPVYPSSPLSQIQTREIFSQKLRAFPLILSNMKQKMVIKVQMTCDKCRSKAMKYAAVAGVMSVAIAGPEKDRVVVIGDGVDPVSLTRLLRKKVNGSASLVSVEEVKEKKETKHPIPIQCSSSYIYCPQYPMYEVVCDPNPTGCTFM